MTEAEWATSDDPAAMCRHVAGRLTDRQWRLYKAACARRVFHLLADDRMRAAVVAAERHVDGRLARAEYGAAVTDANRARRKRSDADWAAYYAARYRPERPDVDVESVLRHGASAMCRVLGVWRKSLLNISTTYSSSVRLSTNDSDPAAEQWGPPIEVATYTVEHPPRYYFDPGTYGRLEPLAAAERRAQAALLRDIVGDPFSTAAAEPRWATADVIAVARTLYDSGDFGHVRDLGVALSAAGCDDPALLAHCFAPVQHVRGCWAVDLILGQS